MEMLTLIAVPWIPTMYHHYQPGITLVVETCKFLFQATAAALNKHYVLLVKAIVITTNRYSIIVGLLYIFRIPSLVGLILIMFVLTHSATTMNSVLKA